MRCVMRHLRRSRARCLAGAVIAALAFTATASAGSDRYTLRQTAEGKAAARAVMLQKADLGSPADWKGGPVKVDISTGSTCANYHPKASDLVLSGASAASYVNSGITMRSDSEVFATERMMKLDWQRTAGNPHFFSCLRASAKKGWTGDNRFVSLQPLVAPGGPPGSIGIRLVISVTRNGGPRMLMAVDTLGFGRGKTEIALTTILPLAMVTSLFPNELVVFKTLSGRIRP
jgi:hypothetical protein